MNETIEELKKQLEFYKSRSRMPMCHYCNDLIVSDQSKIKVVRCNRNLGVNINHHNAFSTKQLRLYHDKCYAEFTNDLEVFQDVFKKR